MKIGMTSLTLREEPVENVIKYAKEAGISGIEWGVSDLHMPLCDKSQAEKIKKLSEENGIEIFSLGSYCRMLDKEDCDKTLETAVMLSAPIIRLWAGKGPWETTDRETIDKIVENTLYMSEKAKEYGIRLGFEYHTNTLTQGADNAVRFMKEIKDDNVGLYWQPSGNISAEENLAEFKKVMPYLVGNLHVHNHNSQQGYQPLSDIKDNLKLYYNDIKEEDYNLMIEFVKDSSVENLFADAKTLLELF